MLLMQLKIVQNLLFWQNEAKILNVFNERSDGLGEFRLRPAQEGRVAAALRAR
jgi:hypothetical protein